MYVNFYVSSVRRMFDISTITHHAVAAAFQSWSRNDMHCLPRINDRCTVSSCLCVYLSIYLHSNAVHEPPSIRLTLSRYAYTVSRSIFRQPFPHASYGYVILLLLHRCSPRLHLFELRLVVVMTTSFRSEKM